MIDVSALDFIVVNVRTGNPVAAFMLPRDAILFIKARRAAEGPTGPVYDLVNRDGSMMSPELDAAVDSITRPA